jgi:hypothetical protein
LGVSPTTFGSDPSAAAKTAAGICAQHVDCVGFEVEGGSCSKGHCWVQFVKMNTRLTTPFPDADWDYFYNVSATHDPYPTPAPGPAPGSGIDLNVAEGSVSFFVNKADALASDTSLFKLGMVSLIMTPNPFVKAGTNFSQELDLQTATISIKSGTTEIKVYVDANSNTIHADMTSETPVQLKVLVQSVHPSSRFTYGGGFGITPPYSDPDVMMQSVDPMMGPAAASVDPSTLPAGPAGVRTFDADTLVIYHENKDTDEPRAFNDTLLQQGLGRLIPGMQTSDHWRKRKFGMAISGTAVGGAAASGTAAGAVGDGGGGSGVGVQSLQRVSESVLASEGTTMEAHVLISTSSNQTNVLAEWLQQLQQQHATALQQASAARAGQQHGDYSWRQHAEYWQGFWQRSYISVNASESSGSSSGGSGSSSRSSSNSSGGSSSSSSDDGFVLSQQYALTRFVQAIQSRDQGGNGWVPIKVRE